MNEKQSKDAERQTGHDAAYWDRRAAFYDKAVGDGRRFHREMYSKIRQALSPDDTVAEIACGTGAAACAIAPQVKVVYAGDIAPGMLEIARARARGQGLCNIRFSLENACALNYPDRFFDAVVICAALHLLPDPGRAMAEIRRILKPGGLLFASSYLAGQSLMSRLGNALMSLGGYRDRQMWQAEAFRNFLLDQGFTQKSCSYYPVFPVPVQYVSAQFIRQSEEERP